MPNTKRKRRGKRAGGSRKSRISRRMELVTRVNHVEAPRVNSAEKLLQKYLKVWSPLLQLLIIPSLVRCPDDDSKITDNLTIKVRLPNAHIVLGWLHHLLTLSSVRRSASSLAHLAQSQCTRQWISLAYHPPGSNMATNCVDMMTSTDSGPIDLTKNT
ncbi:hypothetical protein ACP4OV_029997 [Aristida adscensionis]